MRANVAGKFSSRPAAGDDAGMRPPISPLLICAALLTPAAIAGAQGDARYFDPVTEAGQQPAVCTSARRSCGATASRRW